MKKLTTTQQDFIKNIIDEGLAHAAQSLSSITNRSFHVHFTALSDSNLIINFYDKDELFVLISDLHGEIKGKSLFILTKKQAEQIWNLLIPNSNNTEMREAILLEIDNIVTASVVTKLANALKKKMYAGVPAMEVKDKDTLQKDILSYLSEDTIEMTSTTLLQAENLSISPTFIWIFAQDFITATETHS
jgi:chemotaxis protein CheY-P-specific phosphatase CheC